MSAVECRKTALTQLAQEGNEEAGNDLWREFGLIVDPNGNWKAEDYTSLLRTLSEHKP